MAVATRGSWTLDEAIMTRWRESGLDQAFKDEWLNPSNEKYEPLNEGEARPVPPGPYCVYEKGAPIIVGHMSGADTRYRNTENQTQNIAVQFRIHAKSDARESGYAKAKRLAEKVDDEFIGGDHLKIDDDKHVTTFREGDVTIREGDQEWSITLFYEFLIDAEYRQT